eukprot:COSAG01_NODE_4479_length_4986_cov_2.568242_1_plen_281_part_10
MHGRQPRGILYVGPWQELALSKMLAQSRAQGMADALASMRHEQGQQGEYNEGYGLLLPPPLSTPTSERSAPGSQAVSPMSSRSSQSHRTDPTSWATANTDPTTNLFRMARNLKYKGATYERPWRGGGGRRGGRAARQRKETQQLKEQNVAKLQAMYGLAEGAAAAAAARGPASTGGGQRGQQHRQGHRPPAVQMPALLPPPPLDRQRSPSTHSRHQRAGQLPIEHGRRRGGVQPAAAHLLQAARGGDSTTPSRMASGSSPWGGRSSSSSSRGGAELASPLP